jgi:hypothetical protein
MSLECPQATVLEELIPSQDGVASSRLSLTTVITASTRRRRRLLALHLPHGGGRFSSCGGPAQWIKDETRNIIGQTLWWASQMVFFCVKVYGGRTRTHTHRYVYVVYAPVFSHMNSPFKSLLPFLSISYHIGWLRPLWHETFKNRGLLNRFP